jgi:hypothetical protein
MGQGRLIVSDLILVEQNAGQSVLSRLEPAVAALAAARDASDAKTVVDMARAAEVYARRQRLGKEAIMYAIGIQVDALTVMGGFLKGPKNKGARGIGTSAVPKGDHTPPTLAELGITKKESTTCQTLYRLSQTDRPPPQGTRLHCGCPQESLRWRQEGARRHRRGTSAETRRGEEPAYGVLC